MDSRGSQVISEARVDSAGEPSPSVSPGASEAEIREVPSGGAETQTQGVPSENVDLLESDDADDVSKSESLDAAEVRSGAVSSPEVEVKDIRYMSDEEIDAVLGSEFPGDTDGMRELRKYIRTHIVN